ncbi:MAG TPA: YciI family protein [Paludibacteraceae bacterium]|nr:YciI family protein [Paludibacteraceae bacterium]
MKLSYLFLSISLALIVSSCGTTKQSAKTKYNAQLAQKLGADELGMKMYVLVILKTGDTKIEDKALRDSLFRGHFANINKLADEGKLVVAGPLEKNENQYRGIFILDVKTFAEAGLLLQNDPTVSQGIFKPEMYEWYGSAALPVYMQMHKKIQKKQVK